VCLGTKRQEAMLPWLHICTFKRTNVHTDPHLFSFALPQLHQHAEALRLALIADQVKCCNNP